MAAPIAEPPQPRGDDESAVRALVRGFLNATAAAAVLDRTVHHAAVLSTATDSYPLKAATRNRASRATQEVPRQ